MSDETTYSIRLNRRSLESQAAYFMQRTVELVDACAEQRRKIAELEPLRAQRDAVLEYARAITCDQCVHMRWEHKRDGCRGVRIDDGGRPNECGCTSGGPVVALAIEAIYAGGGQ